MTEQKCSFVIITQPRSGSYHFKSLLDSAEDIACQGEIFKKSQIEIDRCYADKLGLQKFSVAERNAAPFAFVKQLQTLCASNRIFGFKAFWPHLEPHKPIMNKIIHNPEWKKIFLVRNPLQSYASLLRANKTKIWVRKDGKPAREDTQGDQVLVHFDNESIEKHLATYRRVMKKNRSVMQAQPGSCIEIAYSEITIPSQLDVVLKFLGSSASSSQLNSEYQKQYRGTLLDGFDNPNELISYLDKQGLIEMATTERDVFA